MANVNFQSQLKSIMEVLANAAVAEICQLVDDGYAVLRLEISRTQRENLALKSKLRLTEVRHRYPRRSRTLPSREKDVLPADEDEESTLWQQECGSSVEDDDSGSSAVTGLEEDEEDEEGPAQSADSGTAALGMDLDASPYSPAVTIKEEDETQYQAYGECAVTSQSTQVSRQQADAKEEPSGLAVNLQVEQWFTCYHCGLSYAKQTALTKHLRHTHTPARCKVCDEEFPSHKTLAAHLKISCARKYQRMHKYQVRRRAVEEEPFVTCPTCGQSIVRARLSRHMLTHAASRPYRCQVCGKDYRYRSSYETHQRSHVQEKYQCPDCGKAFKEQSERDFHKCVVFKGEMEFGCSVCGESFGRLTLLKRHRLAEHAGFHFDPHPQEESKTCNQATELQLEPQGHPVCSEASTALPDPPVCSEDQDGVQGPP